MKKIITLSALFFIFSCKLFAQGTPDYNYNTFQSSLNPLDEDSFKEIKVYPNPVNYDFTLEFLTPDIYSVSIMDNFGHEVYAQNEAKDKIVINCQDIQPGFFYLKIQNLNNNNYIMYRLLKR